MMSLEHRIFFILQFNVYEERGCVNIIAYHINNLLIVGKRIKIAKLLLIKAYWL